jgi:DNA-binding transcriptional ArsR family regulator
MEKETTFGFAKCDDYARVYTEEAGIARRLLKHPEFATTELRVNTDNEWGLRRSPDEWFGGVVTGVKGYLPIGALKVLAQSRSTSGHASVVSKEVSSMWETMTDDSDDGGDTDNNDQTGIEIPPVNKKNSGETAQNGQTRHKVSPITAKNIILAIGELGLASSSEIAKHDSVNRSQRQVQRALDSALEEDLVKSVRDGRQVRYYVDKEHVP